MLKSISQYGAQKKTKQKSGGLTKNGGLTKPVWGHSILSTVLAKFILFNHRIQIK
jgi:hypothetical protein